MGVVGASDAQARCVCDRDWGVWKSTEESKAFATREAREAVAEVLLPPGALRTAQEPAGAGGLLASSPEAPLTPNFVDAYSWWTVPGTRQELISYLQESRVKDQEEEQIKLREEGGRESPGRRLENGPLISEDAPGLTPAGPVEEESVATYIRAVNVGPELTAVRFDAEGLWAVGRPRSEVVPTSVRSFVVSEVVGRRTVLRPLRVVKAWRAEQVVDALNRLPVQQPAAELGCPAASAASPRMKVLLYGSRSNAAIAVVSATDVERNGCGAVRLWLRGREEPQLVGGDPLLEEVKWILAPAEVRRDGCGRECEPGI